jgi:hypothetical protein
MKYSRPIQTILFFIILFLTFSFTNPAIGKEFKTFDGTGGYLSDLSKNNPKIIKLPIIDEISLFSNKTNTTKDGSTASYELTAEDEIRIRTLAKSWKSPTLVCLDIERWPANGNKDDVNQTINNFKNVIGWIRQEAPNIQIGIYGIPPIRDINGALEQHDSISFKAWQSKNDLLIPLANLVDVIFPSLYTLTSDPKKWQLFAKSNIEQARRYGKPVYPFIWPRFHDSMHGIARTFIPNSFMKMEIDTVNQLADGIVIWDYSNKQPWEELNTWNKSTSTLLKLLKLSN